MSYHAIYRGGRVHVLSERCATCIFRPGNPMDLEDGRVKAMVDECRARDGVIPCHKTIHGADVPPAICRGFWDSKTGRENVLLRLAESLDVVEFVDLPRTRNQGDPMTTDLTRLQLSTLYAMRELGDNRTPNEIGTQAGAKTVRGGGKPGRGRGHRTFGKAQQIIPVLTSLRKRGLIEFGYRRDGKSGTAYSLTEDGRVLLRRRAR